MLHKVHRQPRGNTNVEDAAVLYANIVGVASFTLRRETEVGHVQRSRFTVGAIAQLTMCRLKPLFPVMEAVLKLKFNSSESRVLNNRV